MVARTRADLGQPGLPFFVGGLHIGDNPNIVTVPDSNTNTSFGEWDFLETVVDAQRAVAASDAAVHFIDTTDFNLSEDYLHFDAPGQMALGEAFGQSYLQNVPEPSAAVLLSTLLLLMSPRGKPHANHPMPLSQVA